MLVTRSEDGYFPSILSPLELPMRRRWLSGLQRHCLAQKEQRVSGRWWMESLYRGNYYYITYIATMQALKALALCEELH